MSYVYLFNFFSLPPIFTLVAASISLFSHRRENIVMFLLRTKLVFFFYLSFYLFFCYLCHAMQTMTTKVERKTRLCCCLIVPSKSPGGHAIYHPNAWVMLEMQNFTTAYAGFMGCTTSANGHLSKTTTALQRPLFSSLKTKNDT